MKECGFIDFDPWCGIKIGDNIEVYTIGWGLLKDGNVAISEIDFNTGKKLLEVTLPQGVANDRVQKFK